ncbi:putative vesicle-associated membrane-protein-associated protein [Helianthus annuus]|nr:putative vesicle-associated membrane-protein-associated protein [Helianthus annuus]KAJ0460231.1 putative vesicle-associated membrane-protein-associated protein [Helianthus annuus]KAJ0640668.1 putative vesicle-associated membrane-protein-associated protein [Helianthus annuus]
MLRLATCPAIYTSCTLLHRNVRACAIKACAKFSKMTRCCVAGLGMDLCAQYLLVVAHIGAGFRTIPFTPRLPKHVCRFYPKPTRTNPFFFKLKPVNLVLRLYHVKRSPSSVFGILILQYFICCIHARALISKLTDEKNAAIQQSNKIRQEIELLSRGVNKSQGGGVSIAVVIAIALIGLLLGYLLKNN